MSLFKSFAVSAFSVASGVGAVFAEGAADEFVRTPPVKFALEYIGLSRIVDELSDTSEKVETSYRTVFSRRE